MFTGKGGVGKSTVVAGLALEAARRGRRPLVVELGHRATMESIFDVPVTYDPVSLGRGVHGMNMTFERTLTDYMTQHVPVPRLAKTVVRNRVLSRFFAAAPAVSEIALLNKLNALVLEQERGRDRWDPVIVDLDATGHALMLLNLPRVMDGLVGQGPMRNLVDGFSQLLTDPRRTVLSLVTLPRELPVQETVELYETLRGEHKVSIGALFVNQVPHIPMGDELFRFLDPLEDRAEAKGDAELLRDASITRRMLMIQARARGQIDRLNEEVPLPMAEIPTLYREELSLDDLANIGREAMEALERPPAEASSVRAASGGGGGA